MMFEITIIKKHERSVMSYAKRKLEAQVMICSSLTSDVTGNVFKGEQLSSQKDVSFAL
jgi:hypothetical protein